MICLVLMEWEDLRGDSSRTYIFVGVEGESNFRTDEVLEALVGPATRTLERLRTIRWGCEEAGLFQIRAVLVTPKRPWLRHARNGSWSTRITWPKHSAKTHLLFNGGGLC